MSTYFSNCLSLSIVTIVFLSLTAFAGEHPSEHPEHPKHSRKHTEKVEPQISGFPPDSATARSIVGDISSGIKSHINAVTERGDGKYKLNHKGTMLALELEKVHEDKLAQLDNGYFFACTDFKGTDGNTYDVDFFLSGSRGNMWVTDATVHKINGSPLYTWRQNSNGKWVKDPVSK